MATPDSGTTAVLAEKPSVARDIARVLGASTKGDGYLHGNGYVVVWAIGHLAALAQPHEIRPEWRQWRRDLLPMLPTQWPLVVYEQTKDQFEVVRRILNSPRVARVVCATDAGREGELIFRYIYEAAQCSKPVNRLWISSLTPDAIRKGFDTLRPGRDYDPLSDAARGRSRADWLVGMNLSRAYTLSYGEDLSVGRVQTPTLAMLVERELTVRAFVPEDYYEVLATFHPQQAPAADTYRGTWFRARPEEAAEKETLQKSMRLPADGEEANQVAARARTGRAVIESVTSKTERMPPPALYDLTELQRHANRLYGFSAQKTLDLAQALYERHKLLSYPRTDSRYLSRDVAATLPKVVAAVSEPYRDRLAPGSGDKPLGRRFVDDARVSDHHAIIPTTTSSARANLNADEARIYDLVCRRLLSAWHDDHIWSVTTVITAIANPGIVDRYHTSGTAVQQVGWKVLDIVIERKARKTGDDQPADQALPAGLAPEQPQDVINAEAVKKKTRPPKRFTEGTLLTAMETAGKTLDEKELSDAMKESGLGTPATRAGIIEVLLKRGYIERNGKILEATDKGVRLIEVVHPEVKSPAMTGQWEAYLKRIERGQAELTPFLKGIEDYVTEVVGKVGQTPAAPRVWPAGSGSPARAAAAGSRVPARSLDREPHPDAPPVPRHRSNESEADAPNFAPAPYPNEPPARRYRSTESESEGSLFTPAPFPDEPPPARRHRSAESEPNAPLFAPAPQPDALPVPRHRSNESEADAPNFAPAPHPNEPPPARRHRSAESEPNAPLFAPAPQPDALPVPRHRSNESEADAPNFAPAPYPDEPPPARRHRSESVGPAGLPVPPDANEAPTTLPRTQSGDAASQPRRRLAGPEAEAPLFGRTPHRSGAAGPGAGVAPRPNTVPPRSEAEASALAAEPLAELLHRVFGFATFRPNQEAVCQAAVEGKDVLLVMPTGSGKSLCYQLPGIARGGTTLVISPLIALMEDQVAKLKTLGLAVERIHSGRDRGASRQACIDYLNGRLQFLFIAPERLRVSGFPEMLAKRKPCLIAIDEAHCISQWGHDFRPDYRKIGEYLPTLRPAPVMALTATATPIVQNDIVSQLGLIRPECLIHGFRRDNIAIEIVEIGPSYRPNLVARLLESAGRRPAIVYTPTRKLADSLAASLSSRFPAAAYHAGLDSDHRKHVQQQFLERRLDVMVATIAFGMGIDKSDVRTVIHTALPGSLEAYYQEVGRAGRDGLPSRAVLMHSYADRHTHDFFIERDYPDPSMLDSIFRRLTGDAVPKQVLQRQSRIDSDAFDNALEKLWIHGGAILDFAENVTRGHDRWRELYIAQGEHKRAQIELVIRYAESNSCRMSGLVRHFGDLADGRQACGICDFCAPDACVAQRFRTASDQERKAAIRIIEALRAGESRPTGRLHGEVSGADGLTRDEFEEVLGAMARAGLIHLRDAVFEKDGRSIPYRKASLSRDGHAAAEDASLVDFTMKDAEADHDLAPRRRGRKKAAAKHKGRRPAKAAQAPAAEAPAPPPRGLDTADSRIADALRAWRLQEAKRRGVPAFRIFSDKTLVAIAEERPSTARELLAIPGIGISLVEKYGAQIYRILHEG